MTEKGSTAAHQLLVKEILLYLSAHNIFCWQNSTGAIKSQNRFVRFGLVGSSDIFSVLPNGKFFCIEVKSGFAKQSKQQIIFEKKIKGCNAFYLVAHSIECVKDFIESILFFE